MIINISEQLVPKILEAAKKKGFAKLDDFVTRLIEEKLSELEAKEKIFAIAEKVRTAYEAKGISEEETLADFEKFRERLFRERTQ
jgi:uncharacterized protein YcaQ